MNKSQIERLQVLEKSVNRRDPFQKTLLDFVKELSNVNTGTSIADYNVVGNGVDDDTQAIKTACNNSTGLIVPKGIYRIRTNLTITVPVELMPGAVFLIDESVTLTFSKSFTCGLHHCFTGEGDVIFESGSIKEAYVQWFGAVSNDSINRFANSISGSITKALSSYNIIRIPKGNYYLEHTVTIDTPCNINLDKENGAVIYTDKNIDFFVITSNAVWIDGGVYDATNVVTNTGTSAVFHYLPKLQGMLEGGITNFFIKGRPDTLKEAGNGIIGIYLDWIDAEYNSYIYRHKWHGSFEHVKYALYETTDGGNGASNACWHDINLQVWIAKHALVLNRSTECKIKITFQSSPILHTSEKEFAAIVLRGVYGCIIEALFVDMAGRQFMDWESIYYLGWWHFYTIEDYTGKNIYIRTNTDIDISERQRKQVGGVSSGYASTYADNLSGILPSLGAAPEGLRSAYYGNRLLAADKRYNVTVGYYEKPSEVDFEDITVSSAAYGCTTTTEIAGSRVDNIWAAHSKFTVFSWSKDSNPTDYIEIFIDGIDKDFIRFFELYITGGISEAYSGVKQLQVITRDFLDRLVMNKVIDLDGSYSRVLRYATPLNPDLPVKSILVRFIGTYTNQLKTAESVDLAANRIYHPQSAYMGRIVYFKEVGNLTGISVGVEYYIVNVNALSFQVSLTNGGEPIDLGGVADVMPIWNNSISYFTLNDFCVFSTGNNPDNYPDNNTAPMVTIAGNQTIYNTLKVAGTSANPADLIVDSAWNGKGLLRLGDYWMWIDAENKLRLKKINRPTADDDGYLV